MTETTTGFILPDDRIELRDPDRIQPWHDYHDDHRLNQLTKSMQEHGWDGPPIVVIEFDDRDPIAVTGSHRLAAANATGIDAPTVSLDELLRANSTSLAAVDEQTGCAPDDELHTESVVRLNYFLPASVVDYYGLDAH